MRSCQREGMEWGSLQRIAGGNIGTARKGPVQLGSQTLPCQPGAKVPGQTLRGDIWAQGTIECKRYGKPALGIGPEAWKPRCSGSGADARAGPKHTQAEAKQGLVNPHLANLATGADTSAHRFQGSKPCPTSPGGCLGLPVQCKKWFNAITYTIAVSEDSKLHFNIYQTPIV